LILVATSWAIVTPRERIRSICDDLARLVDEGNVTELEKRVSRNFRAGGMDRKEFLDRLDAVLTRYRLDQIRLHDINVHMEANDEAETTLNARCNIRSAEEFTASIPTRWRLRFSKQGEDWLLKEVESVPIPPLHLRNPLNR